MLKASAIILGAGLIALAIVGWTSMDGVGWLSLLNLLAGLWSLMLAASSTAQIPEAGRGSSTSPLVLGIGLVITWLIALPSSTVPSWQAWWTFAVGCCFVLVSIADFIKHRPGRALTH